MHLHGLHPPGVLCRCVHRPCVYPAHLIATVRHLLLKPCRNLVNAFALNNALRYFALDVLEVPPDIFFLVQLLERQYLRIILYQVGNGCAVVHRKAYAIACRLFSRIGHIIGVHSKDLREIAVCHPLCDGIGIIKRFSHLLLLCSPLLPLKDLSLYPRLIIRFGHLPGFHKLPHLNIPGFVLFGEVSKFFAYFFLSLLIDLPYALLVLRKVFICISFRKVGFPHLLRFLPFFCFCIDASALILSSSCRYFSSYSNLT